MFNLNTNNPTNGAAFGAQGPANFGGFGNFGAAGGANSLGFGAFPGMDGMNGQMGQLMMNMMQMMTQLMSLLSGASGLAGSGGQFGTDASGGASPLGSFLGGDSGSGVSSGGGTSSGGTATAAPTGSGASIGPADGSTSSKTQNFINKALSKQGTPYVFGAAGPDKFDCSGLVSWALKEAGVSGGRATARGLQDRYKGSAVKKEDLKPGDLVFFWSPNDRGIPKGQATHVEIYLGDGKTMGTDSPKEGAKVEPISWDTFIGGARVPELNK